MNGPSKMDVADWQDSRLRVVIKERRAPRRFFPPTLLGILCTLLLHAVLIQSVAFASRGIKPKPPEAQESANALAKSTADAGNLVLISLPTITNANDAASQSATSSIPNLGTMKIKSPISLDPSKFHDLETLTLRPDQASGEVASGADGAELVRQFGIYTGQIQARINRVWRRPRTPINESAADKKSADADESFQCEAQIVQDDRGNVQEILLPRCNGSLAWQHSLVLAIQQASPLPAPPSIKVFSQSITLNFVGLSYIQGASNEEYEIVPLARVQ